ncbi:MAG: ribosome-associated translation inhibitor RaiA [Gammaproteobacteria bacterium]|jgi:putative sigma-54 modulation protein|nr:ribosome-associated translation inhibitor RaiA [Gammaproteobacteria bacterium]MBU0770301.1 ribosome-associated translation inhibitor RaiA [Gammaproteobacteria bacterium]MBU0857243.1 ribosome-associated translation inhibitor RaiA [Gammaproteobacteria bacterium]MBU1847918.1 ribosome-associated translation inhibitor RaiA [Gammaproteobacteria bacterium]
MNLTITGHHLEVTPAIHEYVEAKLERVIRHFDHVTNVSVIMSVEKLRQKAEVTLHVRGRDIFAEADSEDMYATLDTLIDKLDRQLLKHKEKTGEHTREALKHQAAE